MMAINEKIFGPKTAVEAEIFAIEDLVFAVQMSLQKLMRSRELTQNDVAKILGMTPARISQILTGSGSNLTLKTIARFAHALDQKMVMLTDSEFNILKRIAQDRATRTQSIINISITTDRNPWREGSANSQSKPTESLAA